MMFEWLSLIFLILTTLTSLHFYIKSVQPAKLEQEIGPKAYEMCERYREYASIFFVMFFIAYFFVFLFPVPLPIPMNLPWDYWTSLILAVGIAIPAFTLMGIGVKHAGAETYRPKKEHEMYGGIYNWIRHPQSLGEVWTGHVIALVLNSTFLFLYSFLWIPIFYYMSVVEERDLILRFGQPYKEYRNRVGMYFPKLNHRKE